MNRKKSIENEGFCDYALEVDRETFEAKEDMESILQSLGYNAPEELDKAILDGTSDLYIQPDDEDDE